MAEERHKANLQGLLKYAISNSNAGDDAQCHSGNGHQELDLEKKQFLENAIRGMTVDLVEKLHKAIHILKLETSTTEQKIDALNEVRDLGDDIDLANNFIQIGGSGVLLECLRSSDTKLRVCAAYVVAELSQNNPYCQKHFLQAGVLEDLIKYTKEDGDIACSSIHAISALIRSFEEGSAKFIELKGLERLLECLHSPHSNVFVKSCFLLRALSTEFDAVRDEVVKLGAVYKLTEFVDPVIGFDMKTEIVLSTLCLLCQTEQGKLQFRKNDISDTLQAIIDKNEGKEECEEMLIDSKAILDSLKK